MNVDIERKLEAATALHDRATTIGEKHAASRAMERLRSKLDSCEKPHELHETVDGIKLSTRYS